MDIVVFFYAVLELSRQQAFLMSKQHELNQLDPFTMPVAEDCEHHADVVTISPKQRNGSSLSYKKNPVS